MVCSAKVVIDRLRNSHNTHLVILLLHICGKLGNGIHRIVTADIEEIADIVLFEDRKYLFKNAVRILFGIGKLLSARAERRSGRLLQKLERFLIRNERKKVCEIVREYAVNAVTHSVKRSDNSLFPCFLCTENDTSKSCVDGCGRAAGLSDDSVSVKN